MEGKNTEIITASSESWLVDELNRINSLCAEKSAGYLKPSLCYVNEDRKITALKYPLMQWETGISGNLTSFICSSMMEFSMSITISCFIRKGIPTPTSTCVEFMRPVFDTENVVVETAIERVKNNNISVISSLYNPITGLISSRACGNYKLSLR